MTSVVVRCTACSKKFSRDKNKANEAAKFGWKPYCSSRCQFSIRLKGEYRLCHVCSKRIWRIPKELKASLTNRFFCNTSCAAIFNNNLRSEALPKNYCKSPGCSKKIPRAQSYCSRTCATYSRKRTPESLKKEVIGKIRKFNIVNGRIPVKKEMYDAYGKARDVFGTWNRAVEAAGFEPNPVLFAKKFTARDGHLCDSFTEKIIDDWLLGRGIPHERNWRYGKTKMTADFKVNGNTILEFFGLAGVQKNYDAVIQKKRTICKQLGLRLIEIYPADLFPKNRLGRLLAAV